MDFDTSVKLTIYQTIVETTKMPTAMEIAAKVNSNVNEVLGAFEQLHKRRLLVPEPGDPTRIRMAPPFSGTPTTFLTDVKGKSYYSNCVWDAFGVAAALHEDGIVKASDGQTGLPITIEVKNGKPAQEPCVIHFAVPAAHWWDDIIYN